MKLLIDTESGSSFFIDVHFLDTVLRMKEKIEESQGTPVFKQTLFFRGKILQDHVEIRFYHIQENSLIFLYISPDDNPNQNVNDDQVSQPEQLSDSSNSFGESSYGGDRALTTDSVCKKNQHDRPLTLQRIIARRIDDGSSRPSYSLVELLAPRDFPPVTVGSTRNRNQEVVQTERASASDSVKEVINIPHSPERKKSKTIPSIKLTVCVKPFKETRMIPVVVNANDKVEELRKELVKMQEKGELNLPHERYYFILREETLIETESFMWNLVADGYTIEIIRINQA